MKRIKIIDYGMGNIWSVKNAFEYLGHSTEICSTPAEIRSTGIYVLPGVGSFKNAMNSLKSKELVEPILEIAKNKKSKILGICLGMQLLGLKSTEGGNTSGLGIINSESYLIESNGNPQIRIPHVGFNEVESASGASLFRRIDQNSDFYFVHSYKMKLNYETGLNSICNYGGSFLAAYEHENVFATQFHPEKSQSNGLTLLQNFVEF